MRGHVMPSAGAPGDPERPARCRGVPGPPYVVYNNVIGAQGWHSRWYTPVNASAAAASLAVAAASGLTAEDLGLGRGRWLPGRLGSLLAAATAAGWLAAAAVPSARPVLDDKRISGLDGRGVAYQTLIRIPVGTAAWGESRLPRGAAGNAAAGHVRARRDRRDQRRVRPVAHPPHRRGAARQRPGRRRRRRLRAWPPASRRPPRAARRCPGCGRVPAVSPLRWHCTSPSTAAAWPRRGRPRHRSAGPAR